MRKWKTLLMTLLVGVTSYANANTGLFTFEAGYRRDDITWKHEFPSNHPVVSSSTKFEDLDIFQIGVQARSTIGCNFYVRGSAYWGWIVDGNFKRDVGSYFTPSGYGYSAPDSNFRLGFSDDRRSIIDDKYVYGIAGAVGYPFYFCDCTTVLAPVIGYAYDQQTVRVDNQGFNFSQSGGYICPGSGEGNNCCRQTFLSRWYGPFVGLDLNYNPWDACWNLYADLEYHWGDFRGKRSHGDGFDFFDHRNLSSHDATGWLFTVGGEYELCNEWVVGLSLKWQDWNASRHHRNSGYSGESYWSGNNRARNENKWHSFAVNFTFGRDF